MSATQERNLSAEVRADLTEEEEEPMRKTPKPALEQSDSYLDTD